MDDDSFGVVQPHLAGTGCTGHRRRAPGCKHPENRVGFSAGRPRRYLDGRGADAGDSDPAHVEGVGLSLVVERTLAALAAADEPAEAACRVIVAVGCLLGVRLTEEIELLSSVNTRQPASSSSAAMMIFFIIVCSTRCCTERSFPRCS